MTQGRVAVVDDVDYNYLNQWKWSATDHGHTFYAMRKQLRDGRRVAIYMHQEMAKRLGFKFQADHINRDGLDNRRRNLRDSTQKQNLENQSLRKDNTSGHKGVHWFKRTSKWQVSIGHNGDQIHLGYFDRLEDAIEARKNAERKYFTHGSL